MKVPEWWVTNLSEIDKLAHTVQHVKACELTRSAGNRPIYCFTYGEKQEIVSKANYSSACGGWDLNAYAPVRGKKPVVILLGAIHGGEVEATAALVNLIHLLEDGRDLQGNPNPALMEAVQGIRLIMIPVCNPDGRARLPFESVLGMTMAEHRHWFQGSWKDGSLVGCPTCKLLHPMIEEKCSYMGTYFNDDGINLMHDNFFHPMARETQALLDLADNEKADFIMQLHGGSTCYNEITISSYVTIETMIALHDLSVHCDEKARKEGLRFQIVPIPPREGGEIPPSFNLVSALHHVCGAVSGLFESNQCVIDEPGVRLNHEQVYRSHMILFEQLFQMARERKAEPISWSTL